MFNQQVQLQLGSMIAPIDNQRERVSPIFVEQDNEFESQNNQYPATYLIALLSDSNESLSFDEELGASYFNDIKNSLYNHYEKQVKRLMQTDQHLAWLENQLKKQQNVINHLQARLGL